MKSGIKKTIAVTSVSAMLLATAAYGTLAYFTDQDTAKNEFTTGNINIDLTETEWSVGVDIEDWNESKKEEASKLDKGFKYGKFQAQGIVPGREIPKNPAVTVQQSSVPTYVRMTVTMPESMFEVSNLNLPEDAAIISIGGMSSEWNLVGSRLADDKVTLIYDYAQIVDAQDDDESLPELFTQVSVSEKATNDDVQEALTSEIPKNPAVTVQQSSVPTYVRMTVTMPESMFEVSNLNLPEDAAIISIGGMSSEWNLVGSRLADDKVTLIYDYAQIVDAQDDDESLPELFTQVSVSEKATNDDVQEALTSEFDMEINAYAVQAEGFNTAAEAFGATFEETVPVSLLNDN